MTPTKSKKRAPKHLRPTTRHWWQYTAESFELEDHHYRLLSLAGEAWDRGQMAREAIAKHGLVYVDRFDSPRARPEVAIQRDAEINFARLLRELALDVDPPRESRPPGIGA